MLILGYYFNFILFFKTYFIVLTKNLHKYQLHIEINDR